MVSNTTTNYSGVDGVDGVFVATSVTIGYDTPWRQVESLLLMAAERTPSVRQSPAPVVRQGELQDFYVKYTLLVCPERPERRHEAMSVLHANILDAFNEYGVQITSPNYEADPHSPKIVPRSRWYRPRPNATTTDDREQLVYPLIELTALAVSFPQSAAPAFGNERQPSAFGRVQRPRTRRLHARRGGAERRPAIGTVQMSRPGTTASSPVWRDSRFGKRRQRCIRVADVSTVWVVPGDVMVAT